MEWRKITRLVVLALTTGITTAATAYMTAAQTGAITSMTSTIAILGGVVALCQTIVSGLSEAPGVQKKGKSTLNENER